MSLVNDTRPREFFKNLHKKLNCTNEDPDVHLYPLPFAYIRLETSHLLTGKALYDVGYHGLQVEHLQTKEVHVVQVSPQCRVTASQVVSFGTVRMSFLHT